MDDILERANIRVEDKQMDMQKYNNQVDTVLRRLDADAKERELVSAKEKGILTKQEKARIDEKYEKLKEKRKEQKLHEKEGEIAGNEKYEELKSKPTLDIVKQALEEHGLGKWTIDKIHEIHKDQAHVDNMVRNKEDFLKRTDLEPADKAIKQAILLIVGKMYELREDSVSRLPKASEYILDPYRVKTY